MKISRWFYLGFGFGMGYLYSRHQQKRKEAMPAKQTIEAELTLAKPEPDILLEIGHELMPLVNEEQGGDLMQRIPDIRSQCADEIGVALPAVKIVDNDALESDDYAISIKGLRVGCGRILVGGYLAVSNENVQEPIEGIEAVVSDGLPGLWITEEDKEKVAEAGYTILVPSAVLSHHLLELFKQNAHEWLGLQETQN